MGFGTRSCMVFCYLNAACAVLIGYFFRIGITSMAVASVVNNWDRQQKARAIFNAGILYLIVAVAMTVKNFFDGRKERRAAANPEQRLADYGLEFGPDGAAEAAPLLERRAFVRAGGSQGSGAASRQYGGTA